MHTSLRGISISSPLSVFLLIFNAHCGLLSLLLLLQLEALSTHSFVIFGESELATAYL